MRFFRNKEIILPDMSEDAAESLFFEQLEQKSKESDKFDHVFLISLSMVFFVFLGAIILIGFWENISILSKILLSGILFPFVVLWFFYTQKSFSTTKRQIKQDKIVEQLKISYPHIKSVFAKKCEKDIWFFLNWRDLSKGFNFFLRAFLLSLLCAPLFFLVFCGKEMVEKMERLAAFLFFVYFCAILYGCNLFLLKYMKRG